MDFNFQFGRVGAPRPDPSAGGDDDDAPACVLLFGDFSARGARGEVRDSATLATTRPRRLDLDNLDALIAGYAPTLRLDLGGGAAITLAPRSLDDLHPDALYDSQPVFAELAQLRRDLGRPGTSEAAAARLREWGAAAGVAVPAAPVSDRMRIDAELADFSRLLGFAPAPAAPAPASMDSLLRAVVAPHIVPGGAPDAEALIAVIDETLSGAMRALLHHPAFQALEAAWRGLDFLIRRVDEDPSVQVWLHDWSADEFAADLSAHERLEDSALHHLLVEAPAQDIRLGRPAVIAGLYTFAQTATHAALLARTARLAALAGAPFLATLGAEALVTDEATLPEEVQQAWSALRRLPAARALGLCLPGVLLRAPYGRRTQTIDRFDFEEGAEPALQLWGSAALAAATLLAQHLVDQGRGTPPGALLQLEDLASFIEFDADGDPVAVRCTQVLLNERQSDAAQDRGFMPLVGHKQRELLRLAGWRSLAGTELAGPWTAAGARPDAAAEG